MSDEMLVRAFQAGDTSAFEELFMRYQTQALRSAVLITGNYYDGENVLQEAFIKCYRFLPKLKKTDQFKTWFYRILTRTAWAYCKKQKKEQPVEEIYDVYQASLPLEKSLLEIVEENEYQSNLLAAINRLNPKQRIVVILYYYDEMKIKDISRVLKISESAVKKRLERARNLIREIIERNYKND